MGVVRYTFLSDTLGEQVNVNVILPSFELWRDRQGSEAYYREYGRKKTLYLLHGGSDDSSMYLRRTRIEEYAMEYDMGCCNAGGQKQFLLQHDPRQELFYLFE